MSLKLLLPLMIALSLTGCARESSSARQFIAVPLKNYPDNVQADAAAKIEAKCGPEARCPVDATLEQMVLDYGKERAMLRAITDTKK
jgi:hypothetical protein